MDIFTTFIYQPLFNILIGLYWLVGQLFSEPDMGIAMIFFAVAVRLLLLPIDLAGERSNEEKLKISSRIREIKVEFATDPVKLKQESRRIMRQSPGAIISEIVNVIIQVVVIIVLYRIFTTGLEGADLHLIYAFMPNIKEPINLMFLGQYDLSHTNTTLNLIQSLMIALNEFFHLYFSPQKPTQKDFVSLVFIFPAVCFLVFIFLPAGKKVYIITSLIFSMAVRFVRQILYLYYSFTHKPAPAQVSAPVDSTSSTPSVEPQKEI